MSTGLGTQVHPVDDRGRTLLPTLSNVTSREARVTPGPLHLPPAFRQPRRVLHHLRELTPSTCSSCMLGRCFDPVSTIF